MKIFSEEDQDALAKHPYTKRLVENYNSLHDFLVDENTLNHDAYFSELICRAKIQRHFEEVTYYISETIPETDVSVSATVDELVGIYMNKCNHEYPPEYDIANDTLEILVRILYKYHTSVISSTMHTYRNKLLHHLFLRPLFQHQAFKEYLLNPLLMRFVFVCTINASIPEESIPALEEQLDAFYEAVLKEGRKLYTDFLNERVEHTAIYKEELIAAAWHPRRIEKWLEVGGFELLEAL
jgi:hypothetical protein